MRGALKLTLVFMIGCGGGGGGGDDDAPMDAPPLSGDKYELDWGPVTVAPGGENTQCV